MKVALYGATGAAGSRILKELVSRGHHVTAIVRDPAKLAPSGATVRVKQGDLSDSKSIAAAIGDVEAVISAYGPPKNDLEALVGVTERQVEALKGKAGVRLIVVGGAGGLNIAPGLAMVDSQFMPEPFKPIARAHVNAFNVLKAASIDWTYFAPAAFFEPGQRTGEFRLGKDDLIANAQQESRISMEDYAVALVDELEKSRHRRQRFTIGY